MAIYRKGKGYGGRDYSRLPSYVVEIHPEKKIVVYLLLLMDVV